MIWMLIRKMLATLPKLQAKSKPAPAHHVAICIGHSRIGDQGAVSVGGVNEWIYNQEVGKLLQANLERKGIKATLITHYPQRTYGTAISWLRDKLNHIGATLAIELHFNASDNPDAKGWEFLYAATSSRGLHLAHCLAKAHVNGIGRYQAARGLKALTKGDRGALFLHRVKPPAVIAEPFFGTNLSDWKQYQNQARYLADCYADGIEMFVTGRD